jgi:S1-C subfamily serine protease
MIAVVIMRFGDESAARMEVVRGRGDMLPDWTPVPPTPVCPLGVGVEDRAGQGALVTQLSDGGAAHRLGMRAGDMIVRVDAADVTAASSPIEALADAMALRGCAESLAVTLLRDGATVQLEIVRAER